MDETIARLIQSGAVSHLCLYHDRNSGIDGDWKATTSYAMRTFPDLPYDVIDRLIGVCQTSCANAELFRRPGGKQLCGV